MTPITEHVRGLSITEVAAPVPQADATSVNIELLLRELQDRIEGEVRFDAVSRALYATDASVYQIVPLGVVIPKCREDVIRVVQICAAAGCPITARGGGTSQAGQAIGPGIQLDMSKYLNRTIEVNPAERWARVEPGIVLDELNSLVRPNGLRFAPDISTASRATLGGMIANNSSGARSLIYGKTIDHVLELHVVLADGSLAHLRPLTAAELESECQGNTLEAAAYRAVRQTAAECSGEIARRFPSILRRVGGYNLDAFVPNHAESFNLSKLIVGSEGTLGIVLEAKVKLVPLPKAKAVLVIHFTELLDALAATPAILAHRPSAIEVTDRFILNYTRSNPSLERLRDFVRGDPGALLIVEFYADHAQELPAMLDGLERDLAARGWGYHYHRATSAEAQSRIWSLREAALGLSMAMKGDAKSLSFVEDTAVAPEKLRDYIDRFLEIVRRHGTTAGVYAHASVGCLHVRPVIDLKTAEGVQKFEAIAGAVSDLVLEYGGALSGEHGDGLVRSPFTRKMFGPVLYEAFRQIKRTLDPAGILNPGKIVDAPPLSANLRYGPHYVTAEPSTHFDYSDYGGLGRAVEMCSGLGVCRKTLDGTMCPSYMATREEKHSTRGRANVLRLAMNGQLDKLGLTDRQVYDVLDLCLECRACKTECPVGVDMARFKSEFLATYRLHNGVPLQARVLGNIHRCAVWGSRLAPVSNWLARSWPARWLAEKLLGMDRRRKAPSWRRQTLARWAEKRPSIRSGARALSPPVLLFNDTFTNYYDPEIGIAAVEVLEAAGASVAVSPHLCCGRPLISQGLLVEARAVAETNVHWLYTRVDQGHKVVFCEPSCLSAVREDVPALLRGEPRRRAEQVRDACLLWEEFLEQELSASRMQLDFRPGPARILVHGHCHQRSMGLLSATVALLSRVPECCVEAPDTGCCGMAGSFGYLMDHYEVSRSIAERRLLPAIRHRRPGTVLVAPGTSCRQQIQHFSRETAVHPAVLLRSLAPRSAERNE